MTQEEKKIFQVSYSNLQNCLQQALSAISHQFSCLLLNLYAQALNALRPGSWRAARALRAVL